MGRKNTEQELRTEGKLNIFTKRIGGMRRGITGLKLGEGKRKI